MIYARRKNKQKINLKDIFILHPIDMTYFFIIVAGICGVLVVTLSHNL